MGKMGRWGRWGDGEVGRWGGRGDGEVGKQGRRVFSLCPPPLEFLPNALCPLPFALYPLPFALYPLPFALCPLPFAQCPIPNTNTNTNTNQSIMKCPNCEATKISKNGHRRGKQSYICRHCGRQFLESYNTLGYRDSIKKYCLELYFKGMSFRAIERAIGVNHNTVINWVKQTTDYY
ncbi:IS1/IS1595 family N-terminal zinc-binding domain-containing protein [Nostoc linckia]